MTDTEDPTIDRLDLATDRPADERLAALRGLFPEAVTESGVDVDALRRSLGEEVDPGLERFGLTWPGKAECMRVIQTPSLGTLVPMPEASVDGDTTGNVIIEGENLEVLKLLQRAYHGRVKLIYIDPPYNTGKEFIYPDNFKEGLADYLRYSGQVDDEGLKLQANTETDGRYHSKWLSMMYPRLFLARNLLHEFGFIAVSIGNQELSNAQLLMNEVFGEENFVALLVRRAMHTVRNSSKDFNHHADYVLVYARSKAYYESDPSRYLREVVDKGDSYPRDDGDGRGPYKLDPLVARNYNRPYTFEFSNGVTWSAPQGSFPRYSQDSLARMEADGRIVFGGKNPMAKRYLREVQEGRPPDTILNPQRVGFNSDGTRQLHECLSEDKAFPQPKPVELIQYLIELMGDPGALVVDFFAGSGSTGHAVMAANAEDGGSRRFILVQLPESVESDRFDTIADITRARVKAAGERLEADEQSLLPGPLDVGFRALRLERSNFKVWDSSTSDADGVSERLDMAIDHIAPDATDKALLTEITLKSGFPLATRVEDVDLAGLTGYSVADGALLVCLARQLTIEAVEAMVERGPDRIVLLDAGFGGSDELKVNALQTVRARPGAGGETIALQVV
ncbi:site-specific DNA-methyltransferase [Iamia majanohamensis]|uniref:Site-specific DNA-methyltransferase n=1 Tax=Iamia majanohamensis TaxID=467976 RepID=A0AAE9YDA0_9ACTN|nr:site-specific DNA-methyltransferase [Iamia majanohamensis]WCO68939.1 site-specific DNA-methyltransferase [Iamia majanohamensis]